jgi:predicted HTH transcriptional regulator
LCSVALRQSLGFRISSKYQDLERFLQQGVEEHQTLEYKPRGLLVKQDDSVIKPEKEHQVLGFTALAKTVAGFANAEGGLLVLGVKEEDERHGGVVVKKRPGPLSPLPLSVTREVIENQLRSKIQYPVDDITIVSVSVEQEQGQGTIYLIDVPQSIRAPHRVEELWYFQRYNFL